LPKDATLFPTQEPPHSRISMSNYKTPTGFSIYSSKERPAFAWHKGVLYHEHTTIESSNTAPLGVISEDFVF